MKSIGLIQQDEAKNQPQDNEGIEAFWIHGNRFILYSKLLQKLVGLGSARLGK